MDERENLPAKLAAQGLAASVEKRGSLVARGMAVLKKDNDALYRQARAVFDRGDGIGNWNAVDDPAIFSAFKIFRRLADEDYGKAFYPLSILYSGRNEIEDGHTHATHYAQLAFDWCFANQANQDAELWCDLGGMYQFGSGVDKNDAQAAYWYRKAAEQDYARGQWELGSFLTFDDEDHPGSYWLELAAAQGTLSHTGYIRAQSLAEYLEHPKARLAMYFGGIDKIFVASTHDYILCFTTHGYVRWISVNAVPQGDGVSCSKIFSMLGFDREKVGEIISVLPPQFCDNQFVFFATANGTVKKTSVLEFSNIPKRGTHAITLDEGDFLIGVALTDGKHDVMLFSDGGKAVRFDENDVRAIGRHARGVRGMKLTEGQKVIALLVSENEQQSVLTATENGYGKRTPIVEYTRHGRGTQGMIAIQTSARNGKVVAAMLVGEGDEVRLITDPFRIIRTCVSEIREMGRTCPGVTLVDLSEGEKLSSLEKLVKPIVEK